MGRRSTKSSPTTGAALPFDTVGMTILPGRSLPEWAEPAAAAPEFPGPELIADAPVAEVDEAYSQAAEPQATSQVPQEWAAVGATPPAAPTHTVSAPEPAFAMAGAGLVGAAMAGAPAAAVPAGYGHLDQGYPPEPSRYPAAPAAGLAAMAPASAAAPAHCPGQRSNGRSCVWAGLAGIPAARLDRDRRGRAGDGRLRGIDTARSAYIGASVSGRDGNGYCLRPGGARAHLD